MTPSQVAAREPDVLAKRLAQEQAGRAALQAQNQELVELLAAKNDELAAAAVAAAGGSGRGCDGEDLGGLEVSEWKEHVHRLETQLRQDRAEAAAAADSRAAAVAAQLAESERRLQECEQSAWHARAEASELLYAYESEQRATAALQVKLDAAAAAASLGAGEEPRIPARAEQVRPHHVAPIHPSSSPHLASYLSACAGGAGGAAGGAAC